MRKKRLYFKKLMTILSLAAAAWLLIPAGESWAPAVWELTVTVSPSGTGQVSGSITMEPPCSTTCFWCCYMDTDVETLNATPVTAGYRFKEWTGDLTGTTNPASIQMNNHYSVTANFVQTHTLTMQVSGNGSTTPATGVHTYDQGTVVSISASPAAGWRFDSWTGPVADPSLANTTVTMDSDKTVTAVFTLITGNNPPVLRPIGDKSVNEGELLTFSVSASDSDGDPLTYTAFNLPEGASFSGGTFSWAPDYTQAGTYQVIFRVSDGQATDTETITITVIDVNRPPVLDPIGDKRVPENELLEFEVSATDPDDDPLTFSAEGLPEGASFNEHRVSQIFSWTPDYTQGGPHEVTFSVTDGEATDSETITITVSNVNTAPQIEDIGTIQANEGDLISFPVNATDAEGDMLTYQAFNLPPGAQFSPETHLFEWTPAAGQAGTYQVEFWVSDGELTDSTIVTIEVGVSLPVLPEPFPYEEVFPPQGAVGVDPEGVCLTWPEANHTEEYDFFLSRDREFSSVEIQSEGLTEPLYCTGTATTSLRIEGLHEPDYSVGAPTAFRIGEGLASAQNYYWTITALNIHGEVSYPVFGFFTQMLEGEEIQAPQPLPELVYQMISIPLYPEDPDPMAVLGDDLGPYIRSQWRLFRYESGDGHNYEYPNVPPMEPGLAYWLITREEASIDAHGAPVDTETDFVISIPPGFFQLGCPFPFPVNWEAVHVRSGEVTALIGEPENEWINPVLWKYENGTYVIVNVLEPWEGCWVENVSNEEVELVIPPKMFVPEEVAD